MVKNEKKNHLNMIQRLKEKENAHIAKNLANKPGKSLKELFEQRKQSKKDLNEKFFNENFIQGIHKPEIASFKDHS